LTFRASRITESCLVNEEIVNAVIGLTAETFKVRRSETSQTSRMTRSTFEVRDETELIRRAFD